MSSRSPSCLTEAFTEALADAGIERAVDIALAIGSEKLKDTGFGGLPPPFKGTVNDMWIPMDSAPAGFAQLAAGYRARYGTSKEDMERAISHVSWKSHQNSVHSPKAHFQKGCRVSMETIMNAPMISDPLGLFDCSGVSDGSACAILTTPEIARALGRAGDRQLNNPTLGLTHNLGGVPYQGIAAISILGLA